MKLEKEFEISTGHRLPNHEGGCYNLHGHNYWVKVIVDLGDMPEYIDEQGFLIDFSEIKHTINFYFDHRFILYNQDPLADELKKMPGVVLVPYIPTAENMSLHMIKLIKEKHPDLDIHIELNETKMSKVIR